MTARKRKKKIILYLAADLLGTWILIIGGIYLGFVSSFMFHVGASIVLVWYIVRTSRWIRILFDKIFSKPQVIRTKQIRDVLRNRAAPIVNSKISPSYSVVRFNDKRLPGEYIYLDECHCSTGEKVEVVYYSRSKYILKVTKIEADTH